MQQANWMEYMLHLHGYDDQIVMKLTLNYNVDHSMVAGALVEVTKEAMEEVIGLPRLGEIWYTIRTL